MFDMTQAKVGDKLLTWGGQVVEVKTIYDTSSVCEWCVMPSNTSDDSWCVEKSGFRYPGDTSKYDIIGFAEQPIEAVSENKGVKSDQGKTQWSYLPIPAVKAVVDVMAYGDTKYPAPDGSNWKRVPDAKKRYYNAAMRHLTSWWDGEQNDPETGYNHLAHACSNLLFLLWFEIKGYPKE